MFEKQDAPPASMAVPSTDERIRRAGRQVTWLGVAHLATAAFMSVGLTYGPLTLTAAALVVAVPAVAAVWQWCQPAAVALGVTTALVAVITAGVVMARDEPRSADRVSTGLSDGGRVTLDPVGGGR